MTKSEIIKNLEDQAKDKEVLANGDADSIFNFDARALLKAAELLRLRMGEWVSVKDRLPDRDGTYIVATRKGAVMMTHFYKAEEPGCFSGGKLNRLITHWMPLPEPPEDAAGGDTL